MLLKKLKPLFLPLCLLAMVLLTHQASLRNDFMIDDFSFLEGRYNAVFGSLSDFFLNNPSQHYHPLSLLFCVTLFQKINSAFLLHALSLFLFYLNCLLINRFVFLITDKKEIAFLTTILFLSHPVNALINNWLTCSSLHLNSIFLLLSLISFWYYLEDRRKRQHLFFSLLFYFCGLMGFEIAFLLPIYIACLLFFLKRKSLKETFQTTFPFIILGLLYFIIWLWMAKAATAAIYRIDLLEASPLSYFASLSSLIFWYVANLFFPRNLVWIYNISPLQENLWTPVILLLTIVALGIIFILFKWKKNIKSLALVWFASGFLLAGIGIFGHLEMGFIIEPYWFYLSSIGFFLLASILLSELKPLARKNLWRTFVGTILLASFVSSQEYHKIARSEQTFCEHWLKITENNPIALMALGKIQTNRQDYNKALAYYTTLLQQSDYKSYQIYNNIGIIKMEQDNFTEARENYTKALSINPRYAHAYNNLGNLDLKENRLKEAEKNFLRALEVNPWLTVAKLNLARLYMTTQRLEQSLKTLMQISPRETSQKEKRYLLCELASCFLLEQQLYKTLDIVEAITKEDQSTETLLYLAHAFVAVKASKMARLILKKTLDLHPREKEVYLFYGAFLANKGRLPRAIDMWKKGLALDPDDQRFAVHIEKAKQLLRKRSLELQNADAVP